MKTLTNRIKAARKVVYNRKGGMWDDGMSVGLQIAEEVYGVDQWQMNINIGSSKQMGNGFAYPIIFESKSSKVNLWAYLVSVSAYKNDYTFVLDEELKALDELIANTPKEEIEYASYS